MVRTRAFFSACLLLLTLVVLPSQPAMAASSDWEGVIDITFPVTGSTYRYSNDYHHGRSRGAHGATDIMAPYGTPIVAAQSGTVTWVSTPASSGCGYCLDIRDGNGRTHGYIHLGPKASGRTSEAFSQSWKRGDRVSRGQVIGYVGCSGNASCGGGEHLHYLIEDPGVRDPYGDARRNPYYSLKAAEDGGCDPDGRFVDVCTDNVHRDDIHRLAAASLTSGCGEDRFCPDEPVTREQMASFLIRALELRPIDKTVFSDVSERNRHYQTIARLAEEEITTGCGSDVFCPKHTVTRGQMAAFLRRALDLPFRSGAGFSDVPAGHTFVNAIGAIAHEGITTGCGGDKFCPERPVTREQMASFLVRAFLD